MVESANKAWTEERTALLHEMRESPPKVLFEALNKLPGPFLTKNAVIGKRDRTFGFKNPVKTPEEREAIRLATRERDILRKRNQRAAAGATTRISPTLIVNAGSKPASKLLCMAVADGVNPKRKELLELDRDECRWPYDASAEEREQLGVSFVFCGNVSLDGPYCFAHKMLSMPRAAEKKVAA